MKGSLVSPFLFLSAMLEYKRVLNRILNEGVRQSNRTGVDTLMVPGEMMQFDLRKGFPAVTTKKLALKGVVGELLGFLRGYTSAAEYRSLDCNVWNQNANENKAWLENPYREGEDDLGYIYPRLWRDMPNGSGTGEKWDQIQKLLDMIERDKTSRRLIVSAWHPEVFEQAALPPCHVLWQVIIEQDTGVMHLNMYQRSCDFFLGVPFNIASYSILLHILAAKTGHIPGIFTWFGGDVHLYVNHLDQAKEQLLRDPFELPTLKLERVGLETELGSIDPSQIVLENYQHHPAIRAPMAV